MPRAVLTPHPETESDAVEEIQAGVSWNYGEPLAFSYALKGELNRLRIPRFRPPRRSDRLWEHTCFEVFVAVKGHPAYYEINIAPSGEWAVYPFRRYREPATPPKEKLAPEITVRRAGDSLQLDALVPVDRWQAIEPGARLSVALSAVIEDNRGMLSYWALKHPPGKPDFHHADAFALEIERPVPSPSPSPRGRGKG
ncbi:MAG TPA: DOMON-like domain-containing protein [Candidatus Binatia bacterium]